MRTIGFESIHDYQVRYPEGWSLVASRLRADPDTLSTKGYRWTGITHRVELGTTLEEFVAAHPSDHCRTSTRDVTEIDGHRTLRRAGCGFVDGDVMIGRDVYSFSLEGAGPYEPVLLFGRIAATIQLPEPFASTINDFTLSIPPGWEALAATEPDAPDRFYGPGNLNFDVTTDRKTGDPRAVSWAESHFHRRTTLHGDQQFCANGTLAPPARERKFEPSTIEGHPAAVRYSCGYVDAAVVVGDHVVRLTLISPHHGGGDADAFALLTRRLDLGTPGGVGPVWSRTFRSKVHGYVLRYPRDWKVSAASEATKNDLFQALHAPSSLSITVRPKLRSQELYAYADQSLPHHVKDDGCIWGSSHNIWTPGAAMPFTRAKIAGLPAMVRNECDFVDAVIDLDDRALVLVFRSGSRTPRAHGPMFDLFASALEVTSPPA